MMSNTSISNQMQNSLCLQRTYSENSKEYQLFIVSSNKEFPYRLETILRDDSTETLIFESGSEILSAIRTSSPSLIIIDWETSDYSGIDLCCSIRKLAYQTQILMITKKCSAVERISGLNSGADDCISPPFGSREIKARVKIRLSRSKLCNDKLITIRDVIFDRSAHQVFQGGVEVKLTLKEYKLLECFFLYRNHLLSRYQLLELVWGYNFIGTSNVIEVYIATLRSKLRDYDDGSLIKTVRGIGYIVRDKK